MTGLAEDAAVQVAGLRMSFGAAEVLRGVDFDVRYGEVFCLLGPNGAGKPVTQLGHSWPLGRGHWNGVRGVWERKLRPSSVPSP